MFLAQAAPVEALEGQPVWAQIVYVLVTALVTMFVLPYLRRLSEKARAEAAISNQSAKNSLLWRVKEVMLDLATNIATKRFPALAAQLVTKKLSVAEIKAEMKEWGVELRGKTVEYFHREGVDLLETVGDRILDDLVRLAADKVSPFPGKDTAVTLLQDEWTNRLAKFGTEWVRSKWLDQEENPAEKKG
jgi:flagellar basal body-associated protein FliL